MNDFRFGGSGGSSNNGGNSSHNSDGRGNNESIANAGGNNGDGFLSWASTVLSAVAARDSGGGSGPVGAGGGGGASFPPSLFQGCHFGDAGPLFQRCYSGGSSDDSGALPGSAGRVLDLAQPQYKPARVSKSRSSRKRLKSTEASEAAAADDPVTVDGGNVEDVLAKEFGKLSIEQQQLLEKDIVGDMLNITHEDPEFVQQCLQKMDDEIKKITAYYNTKEKGNNSVDKTPYERAMFLAPKRYLTNPDFRLMFLRADEFDAKLAAQRIVKFFQMKKLLFGESKLCEPITVDDMLDVVYDDETTDEGACHSTTDGKAKRNITREIFLSGAFQTLPCTDRSGRPVTFFAPRCGLIKRPGLHLFRVTWYHIMVALENVNAQKRGLVHIQYEVGKATAAATTPHSDDGSSSGIETSLEQFRYSRMFADALPMRYVAVHFCYDDPAARLALSLFSALSQSMRLRFKFHYGKEIECLYELMEYGIAHGIVPVASNGVLQKADFLQFVERRRLLEGNLKDFSKSEGNLVNIGSSGEEDNNPAEDSAMQHSSTASLEAPSSRDVLLGRGKPYQDFAGNIYFGKLIDQYLERHNAAQKFEKTIISMSIVQTIKNRKGRFLKKNKDTGLWDVVSDDVARDKVAHAFRTKTQKNNAGSNVNNNNSYPVGVGLEALSNHYDGDRNTKVKRPKLV